MADNHNYNRVCFCFVFAYLYFMKYKLALIIDNREIIIINSYNGACLSRHKGHNDIIPQKALYCNNSAGFKIKLLGFKS